VSEANEGTQTSTTDDKGARNPGGGNGFAPITTQEDFDNAIGARLNEERAKFVDYDEAKSKAAKFDELEEQSKTELQRATDAHAKAEDENAQLKSALAMARIEGRVIAEAAAKGIVDPDAAVALLDRSKVKVDDAGKPTNVGELLDELVKAKPYLVARGRSTTPGSLPGGAQTAPEAAQSMDDWMRRQRAR
jgi:hypothetical protein